MIFFERRGAFKAEPELNRQLVQLEHAIESALRKLDAAKEDRFQVRHSNRADVEAKLGELWLLDTATQAIRLYLPRVTENHVSQRVGVVRLYAGNAVTTHATGTLVGSAATHAPAASVLTVYETDGSEWWVI